MKRARAPLIAALLSFACDQPPIKEIAAAEAELRKASAAAADVYVAERYAEADAALQDARRRVGEKDYRGALSSAMEAADRARLAQRLRRPRARSPGPTPRPRWPRPRPRSTTPAARATKPARSSCRTKPSPSAAPASSRRAAPSPRLASVSRPARCSPPARRPSSFEPARPRFSSPCRPSARPGRKPTASPSPARAPAAAEGGAPPALDCSP